MKRSTKKTIPKVPIMTRSNLYNLRFDEFPNSEFMIDNINLDINTGFIDNEKLLTLNFTCIENEILEAFDYFVPLILSNNWVTAKLSIYSYTGIKLKCIVMEVQILRFSEVLSWNNDNTPLKYNIEARFKFVN